MTKRSFLMRLGSLGGALVAIAAGSEPAQAAAGHKNHHHQLSRHRRHIRRKHYRKK